MCTRSSLMESSFLKISACTLSKQIIPKHFSNIIIELRRGRKVQAAGCQEVRSTFKAAAVLSKSLKPRTNFSSADLVSTFCCTLLFLKIIWQSLCTDQRVRDCPSNQMCLNNRKSTKVDDATAAQPPQPLPPLPPPSYPMPLKRLRSQKWFTVENECSLSLSLSFRDDVEEAQEMKKVSKNDLWNEKSGLALCLQISDMKTVVLPGRSHK